MIAIDINTYMLHWFADKKGGTAMDDETINVLDSIGNDAGKIQAICRLAIDPADGQTNPDVQTALYIVTDYANKIKIAASKVMM